ncbi:MAG: 50S ribosomal protein L25 [Opitutaceae bacterium]|nr:50S ribosomal protein L25 [Opitutaceae bacterium]
MKQLSLNVSPRSESGRRSSRSLRSNGRIPVVLYGKHTDPLTLSIETPEFSRLMKTIAGTTAIIELNEKGAKKRLSVIQEIQKNPITDMILHVDFHEVSAGETITTDITIHVIGEAVGVKVDGALLETVSHTVHIRCLPKDLPSFIEVDVTTMEAGQTIHLKELPAIAGVEFLDDGDKPIVSCIAASGASDTEEEAVADAVTEEAASSEGAEEASDKK